MLEHEILYPPITEPQMLPPALIGDLPPLDSEMWLMPFTKKQRQAILDRDGNKCRATVPHQHSTQKYPLEVDHIIPQRYGATVGLDEDSIDRPENALTKCRNAHDLKHRDRIAAREKWQESHNGSFQHMFEERAEKLDNQEIYWDDSYDRTDMVQALKLTQEARKHGWVFPSKKKKQ